MKRSITAAIVVWRVADRWGTLASQSPCAPSITPDANGYVGNEACAKCHAAIYESYQRTAMAHASGPATDNLIAGDFLHKKSGVNYRIYTQDGKVWLSFDRPGDPSVQGKRELLYYIGQGRRGRHICFGGRIRLSSRR